MASYNYDGLLIMNGPQDFEDAGVAEDAEKTLIAKIDNVKFPRSVTASFTSGKVPHEASPQIQPGAVITELIFRVDSLSGTFTAGTTIDVGIDNVDDLANPTVTNFTSIASLAVSSITAAGQALRVNLATPIVAPTTGITNFAINTDLSALPDFEATVAVEFYAV